MFSFAEICKKTKENFWFLIKIAKTNGANISKILARPNRIGETVFSIAYDEFSDDYSIIKCFQDNNVEINHMSLEFYLPRPRPEDASFFILEGLNLKIIAQDGRSPLMCLEDFNMETSRSFSPEMQKLIKILPNSAYFSTDEQKCSKRCPARVLIQTFSVMTLNSSELLSRIL